MDPASAIGLAGSVLSIVGIISNLIQSLKSLRDRYSVADLLLASIIGELSAIRAALQQIQVWIHDALQDAEVHYQLAIDVEESLRNCRLLASFIEAKVGKFNSRNDSIAVRRKLRVALEQGDVESCLHRLARQLNTLHILGDVVRCRTAECRKHLLHKNQNRALFDQIRDDASSLVVLYDSNSTCRRKSAPIAVPTSLLSLRFDFDEQLLQHKAYQNVYYKLLHKVKMKKSQSRPQETSFKLDEAPQNFRRHSRILAFEAFGGSRCLFDCFWSLFMTSEEACRAHLNSDILACARTLFNALLHKHKSGDSPSPSARRCLETIRRVGDNLLDHDLPPKVIRAVKEFYRSVYRKEQGSTSLFTSTLGREFGPVRKFLHRYSIKEDPCAGRDEQAEDGIARRPRRCSSGVQWLRGKTNSHNELTVTLLYPRKCAGEWLDDYEDISAVLYSVDVSPVMTRLWDGEAVQSVFADAANEFRELCLMRWLGDCKIILLLANAEFLKSEPSSLLPAATNIPTAKKVVELFDTPENRNMRGIETVIMAQQDVFEDSELWQRFRAVSRELHGGGCSSGRCTPSDGER